MTTDITQSKFSEAEARELTEELKEDYGALQVKIVTAWKGRIWVSLGYASWQEYIDVELNDVSIRPPKEIEDQVVSDLRSLGMSTRGIVAATDLSKGTVGRVLDRASAPDGAVEEDQRVIGLDGKSRPARMQKPTHQPPVENIVDAEIVQDDEDDYDLVSASGLEPATVNLNESTSPGREHVVRAIRELHYGASAPLPMVKKQSKLLEVAFSGGVSDLATLESDKVEDLGRDVADALGVLSDLLSAMATQPSPTFQTALAHSDTVGSIKKTMKNLQVLSRNRS